MAYDDNEHYDEDDRVEEYDCEDRSQQGKPKDVAVAEKTAVTKFNNHNVIIPSNVEAEPRGRTDDG